MGEKEKGQFSYHKSKWFPGTENSIPDEHKETLLDPEHDIAKSAGYSFLPLSIATFYQDPKYSTSWFREGRPLDFHSPGAGFLSTQYVASFLMAADRVLTHPPLLSCSHHELHNQSEFSVLLKGGHVPPM